MLGLLIILLHATTLTFCNCPGNEDEARKGKFLRREEHARRGIPRKCYYIIDQQMKLYYRAKLSPGDDIIFI